MNCGIRGSIKKKLRGRASRGFSAAYNMVRRPGVGAWRSLVAHLFWVQGVVSSNLAAPTTISQHKI